MRLCSDHALYFEIRTNSLQDKSIRPQCARRTRPVLWTPAIAEPSSDVPRPCRIAPKSVLIPLVLLHDKHRGGIFQGVYNRSRRPGLALVVEHGARAISVQPVLRPHTGIGQQAEKVFLSKDIVDLLNKREYSSVVRRTRTFLVSLSGSTFSSTGFAERRS